MKQQMYETHPQTLQDLKQRIRGTYANLSRSMFKCVQWDIETRIQTSTAADSEKFEHLKQRYIVT